MPNITFFIAMDRMPHEEQLAALSTDATDISIAILEAAPANVHVIHVPVLHGRGHPVFAQIDYRLEDFRPARVMERFMAELEARIMTHTGHLARIRCFGHAPASIHARG